MRETALRWMVHGLAAQLAIRKVQVEMARAGEPATGPSAVSASDEPLPSLGKPPPWWRRQVRRRLHCPLPGDRQTGLIFEQEENEWWRWNRCCDFATPSNFRPQHSVTTDANRGFMLTCMQLTQPGNFINEALDLRRGKGTHHDSWGRDDRR